MQKVLKKANMLQVRILINFIRNLAGMLKKSKVIIKLNSNLNLKPKSVDINLVRDAILKI